MGVTEFACAPSRGNGVAGQQLEQAGVHVADLLAVDVLGSSSQGFEEVAAEFEALFWALGTSWNEHLCFLARAVLVVEVLPRH